MKFRPIASLRIVTSTCGVLAQFGGRSSLGLAAAGVPVLGTSADDLECALDRRRFARLRLRGEPLLHETVNDCE